MESPRPVPDFDALWDYDDPAGTGAKFRDLLDAADDSLRNTDWHWQLLTQIARAQGLQRAFDAAHETLNGVESQLGDASAATRIRCLLERGRAFNSSGQPGRARPLFLEAWETGRSAGEDGFAVDAAHMLGIVESPGEALEWNRKALELATSSNQTSARKWAGSLHNNIGWAHFGNNDYETALKHFEGALRCRTEEQDESGVRIARWCIAKTQRLLGRVDEALAAQRQLDAEWQTVGRPDPYVSEELGECLLALDRADDATPYFAKAFAELSQDAWLADNEPDRIARLKQLGNVSD
ncbi:MAG: tetratricopeptide repeat protein [Planctomycetaceae bacterium]